MSAPPDSGEQSAPVAAAPQPAVTPEPAPLASSPGTAAATSADSADATSSVEVIAALPASEHPRSQEPKHWTYARSNPNELCQGDVLRRTEDILKILEGVHPHFTNSKYLFFMVMTQTCDLVMRQDSCKAPYLTIAVVRSLEDAADKQLRSLAGSEALIEEGDKRWVSKALEQRFRDALIGIFNNQNDRYFFLRADGGAGITLDCCAFLRVTIPLRTEHYKTLLAAKIAQLDDLFQAKLGWLTGNAFSRVGTPDWNEEGKEELRDLVKEYWRRYEWIDKALFRNVAKRKGVEPARGVEELMNDPTVAPKTRAQEVLEAVNAVWRPGSKPPDRDAFVRSLRNNGSFARGTRED